MALHMALRAPAVRAIVCRPSAALRPAPPCRAERPAGMQSSFLRPTCSLHSLCSSFTGLRLSSSMTPQLASPSRRGMTVVAKGGNSIGNTKGGTRRARTRTSGFRTRRLTPGGRHVLRNRRARGRKVLAPGCYRK